MRGESDRFEGDSETQWELARFVCDRGNPDGCYELSNLFRRNDQIDEAISAMSDAVRAAPEGAIFWFELARLYAVKENFAFAAEAIGYALEYLRPENEVVRDSWEQLKDEYVSKSNPE